MTISIIGHGYVGLVTACVFADFGNTVHLIGRTPAKIKKLKSGDPIIYEPGLAELLKKNLKAGRLKPTLDYSGTIPDSDVVFIAVGTPPGGDGEADLSSVFAVAEKIGENLGKKYTVVSCKSTVPVGTNLKVKKIIGEKITSQSKKIKFDIASCPEFLREGTGISDTLKPDRVVVGVQNQKAADVLLELHKPINGKRVVTDLASAELIKYASNSILATKISFANLISFYCDQTGADVEQVLDAVGFDNRIGRKFLYPGIGYGGACFPKDVQALAYTGKQLGVDTTLLDSVQEVNFKAKAHFVDKILDKMNGSKNKKIAIWGLSFKPNTDDIREAPSRFIIKQLLKAGFKISVYDHEAMGHIQKLFGDKLTYCDNPHDAAKGADALCVLTEWNEFRQMDLDKVKKEMKKAIIFDGRNIYDPDKMKKLGFEYHSVGRKSI